MSVYGGATDLIPVGDPRRALIGRAAIGVVLAAAVFFVFTATKQIKPVYLHAPWQNDPYDTVFSFTMFFVPLVVACFLVQVSLCRKSEALPTSRVVTIVRGCRVAVGGIVIELLSAWVAVAIGANRSQWSGAATGALIALLSLCTVVTAKVMVDLHRVPRLATSDPAPSASVPTASVPNASVPTASVSDWLADVVTVAERESRWLGPLRRPALSVLGWTDRNLVRHVRRHPLAAAAVASGGFAVVVFGWQAIREGYFLPVTLVEMGLGFCGMFAFLVLAGSYLGIARSPKALSGPQRRAVDASVAACAVAIATLAFRDSLWWIVGSTSAAAGLPQFATLLGSTTLLVFVVVFAAETVGRFRK